MAIKFVYAPNAIPDLSIFQGSLPVYWPSFIPSYKYYRTLEFALAVLR